MTSREEQRNLFQVIRHELVLLIIIAAAAVPLYLFTRKMAAINRHRNAGIALDLYRRAQQQLADHQPERAIASLRQAVTNDRSNPKFAFAFAQALAVAHRDDEASIALLRLRDSAPEDPEINLELARLSVRRRDVPQAVLYYHHALYGVWTGEGIERRRKDVRIELVRLLLEHNEKSRALAELLAMSAEASRTSTDHLELATLLTEAGDFVRARDHFVSAAALSPQSFAALRGAGTAAFQSGDYRTAAQFLGRALEQDPSSKEVDELLETATLVDARDPFKPHLDRNEQIRRLRLALEQAAHRVSECIGREDGAGAFLPSRLETFRSEIESMRGRVTPEALRLDPDLLHAAFDLAFSAEETTSRTCGAPERFDHALLLIGRRHAGGGQ